MITRLEAIQERVLDDLHTNADACWLVGTATGLTEQLSEIVNRIFTARGFRSDMTPIELVDWLVHSWRGLLSENGEVHDILAETLAYRRDALDDPASPCPGDYVTGEHTAVTLAMEAAGRLATLREANNNYTKAIVLAVNKTVVLQRELDALKGER